MGRHSVPGDFPYAPEGLLPQAYQDLYRRLSRGRTPPTERSNFGGSYRSNPDLMWLHEEDTDMASGYDKSKDVTEDVKAKGGIPDPESDTAPDWFKDLSSEVKSFLEALANAGITEAARMYTKTTQKAAEAETEAGAVLNNLFEAARSGAKQGTWRYTRDKGTHRVDDDGLADWERELLKDAERLSKEPAPDPLGEALADLFTAGKKVLKAFVNEVLD